MDSSRIFYCILIIGYFVLIDLVVGLYKRIQKTEQALINIRSNDLIIMSPTQSPIEVPKQKHKKKHYIQNHKQRVIIKPTVYKIPMNIITEFNSRYKIITDKLKMLQIACKKMEEISITKFSKINSIIAINEQKNINSFKTQWFRIDSMMSQFEKDVDRFIRTEIEIVKNKMFNLEYRVLLLEPDSQLSSDSMFVAH